MWRLISPEHVERYPIAGSLTFSVARRETVFGDENGLFTSYEGSIPKGGDEYGAIPFGTKYIWPGGGDNTTADAAIKDLWLANGFEVEEVV